MSADVKAMCARLADDRVRDLASERWAPSFAAYLNRLETAYPEDLAMRDYVERSRALLAGRAVTP